MGGTGSRIPCIERPGLVILQGGLTSSVTLCKLSCGLRVARLSTFEQVSVGHQGTKYRYFRADKIRKMIFIARLELEDNTMVVLAYIVAPIPPIIVKNNNKKTLFSMITPSPGNSH